MNPFITPQQLQRERALFRYMLALERGDDETIIAILEQAETDAVLEAMIFAWHTEADADEDALSFVHDANAVLHLAEEHLVSGAAEDLSTPSPVTIGDVTARLLEDLQQGQQRGLRYTAEVAQEAAAFTGNTTPLPENLSLGALQQMFATHNLQVSPQFLKRFRDAAIYMAMGHERAADLAARRQGTRPSPNKEPHE